jgi:CheY-like chemotaxis protein
LLSHKGFNVTTADSVAAAVRRAEWEQFDVRITDISMPGGSGYDLIPAVAQRQGIPAIALTANAFPAERERGLHAGFCDFLFKPVSLEALVKAITRAINDEVPRQRNR